MTESAEGKMKIIIGGKTVYIEPNQLHWAAEMFGSWVKFRATLAAYIDKFDSVELVIRIERDDIKDITNFVDLFNGTPVVLQIGLGEFEHKQSLIPYAEFYKEKKIYLEFSLELREDNRLEMLKTFGEDGTTIITMWHKPFVCEEKQTELPINPPEFEKPVEAQEDGVAGA